MQALRELLAQYGLGLVFVNVLVEQLGLPVPAIPILVLAGGLASDGDFSALAVFAAAFAASTIGDTLWFVAGRRYGLGRAVVIDRPGGAGFDRGVLCAA